MRHDRATWRWRHFTTTTTQVWSLRFLFPHSDRRSADVRSASELQRGHLYETRNNFTVCVNLTLRLLWTTKSRFCLILGWSLQGERKYVMTWELTECVRPAMSLAVFECECLAVYLMSYNYTKKPTKCSFFLTSHATLDFWTFKVSSSLWFSSFGPISLLFLIH